jgi:hypothetical protein
VALREQVKQEVNNRKYDEGDANNGKQTFYHCYCSLKLVKPTRPADSTTGFFCLQISIFAPEFSVGQDSYVIKRDLILPGTDTA